MALNQIWLPLILDAHAERQLALRAEAPAPGWPRPGLAAA